MPTPALLFLGVALAQDAPCDAGEIDAYLQAIESSSKPAYLCLAELDEAGAALLAAVTESSAPSAQLTRALAIHWMQRLDEPFPAAVARALPAVDRRLLSDAVRARRGRTSPAPEHAQVFEQFSWYTPSPHYTDGRLTEQDRANLEILSQPPPPPPPPEEPSAAEVIAESAATPVTERGCAGGCASTPAGPGGMPLLMLVMMVFWRRVLEPNQQVPENRPK